jgi:mono/diheme cytochrome c family protein
MEIVAFLVPFVLFGIAVIFVAFSGGPGRAREVYLSRGGRLFRITLIVIYVGCGIAVPALVLANREEAEGGVGPLKSASLSERDEEGKMLFRQQCASCHNLDAVNARGVTGPDLDELGEITPQRVLSAIRNGGTGSGRMPKDLLESSEARDVASYVSKVAGKGQGG